MYVFSLFVCLTVSIRNSRSYDEFCKMQREHKLLTRGTD